MKPEEIVTIARKTLNTPYQHQQRVNGLALDCAGLAVFIGKEIGMSVDILADYGRQPVPSQMRASLDKYMVPVPKDLMQIGDVVWIRVQSEPQHLAILGDYPHGGFSLIHAYNGSGLDRVVEHRLDENWFARILAAWRYPGVVNESR